MRWTVFAARLETPSSGHCNIDLKGKTNSLARQGSTLGSPPFDTGFVLLAFLRGGNCSHHLTAADFILGRFTICAQLRGELLSLARYCLRD